MMMDFSKVEQMCSQIIDILIDMAMEEVVDKCPICLEEIMQEEECTLPCHHKLHNKCGETWFAVKLNCPVCRLKLDFRAYALGRVLRIESDEFREHNSDESSGDSSSEGGDSEESSSHE